MLALNDLGSHRLYNPEYEAISGLLNPLGRIEKQTTSLQREMWDYHKFHKICEDISQTHLRLTTKAE